MSKAHHYPRLPYYYPPKNVKLPPRSSFFDKETLFKWWTTRSSKIWPPITKFDCFLCIVRKLGQWHNHKCSRNCPWNGYYCSGVKCNCEQLCDDCMNWAKDAQDWESYTCRDREGEFCDCKLGIPYADFREEKYEMMIDRVIETQPNCADKEYDNYIKLKKEEWQKIREKNTINEINKLIPLKNVKIKIKLPK